MELNPGSRWRSWLDTATSLAVVVGVLLAVWKTFLMPSAARPASAQKPTPAEPLQIGASWRKGSAAATVAVIEYSEFQCPYCGVFARDILPVLEKKYVDSGKVLFVFRHFPLPSHPFAPRATQAAECAGREQRFWEMHDLMFSDQTRLDGAALIERADRLKLDRSNFEACLNEGADDRVRAEMKQASALDVTGTPTFFVGLIQSDGLVKVTDRLSGAKPGLLDPILDKLLKK